MQVVIEESESKIRFVGGSPTNTHIWIRGDIRAGRAEAVRQSFMLNMMHDVSAITGVATQDIWVYLCNLEPTDTAEYGHVLPLPGDESAWFDPLPKPLHDYMISLGTGSKTFKL